MIPRRLRDVRRVETGTAAAEPRVHPIPGSDLTVEWDQPWEAYVVKGPGAPQGTGPLESIEALADALDPVPVPEQVRTALAADRALRPPIADSWRRRVTTIGAVLAPLGSALRMVAPHILGGEDAQAVHVQVDADIPAAAERARTLVEDAGYRLIPYGAQPFGDYLVVSAETGRSTGATSR